MNENLVNLYIGIDPSITSTGICIRKCDFDGNEVEQTKFHVIHKGKLTKKEAKAEEEHAAIFTYHPFEPQAEESDISIFELSKTRKLIEVASKMKEIVCKAMSPDLLHIYVCIEGISYGSIHGTKSIFDLAGLNYIMRYMLMHMDANIELIVAPPSVIKKFATGKGNADKNAMIATFSAIYPNFNIPKIDDVVDAYFMSRYAQYQFELQM